MRYSTLVTALVFCVLSVWTNNSFSQSQICNCLSPGEILTSTPPSDVTICEGDTAVLTINSSGGVSDFPTGYFFQFFGNNALELYRHDYNDNTTDTLSLTPAQMQNIRGGTVKEDTLVALLNNGSVFYFFDDGSSVSHEMKWNFPKRTAYTWQGMDFNESDGNFYALTSEADTSVLYELDTAAEDTIFIAEYIGGFTWLSSNNDGILYSLNTVTDSVYQIDPGTGSLTPLGELGIDADGCQGGDFDPTSGKLYATVFDGTISTTGLIDTATGAYCPADTLAMDTALCPLFILPSDPFSTDSLSVSWTPTDSLSNPDSLTTAAFPDTTTSYAYIVSDDCGNATNGTVTVSVTNAPDPLDDQSCIAMVNYSLDSNCMATVEPEEILTPDYECANQFYEAIITGRPQPNLGPDDVGDTLTVTIQPQGGGNSCWATILVEDKQEPVIVCEDDTVDFGEDPPPVQTMDNCDTSTRIDTLNLMSFTPMPCDTALLYGTTETIVAVDDYGNRSDTCTRTIYVRRPGLDDIVFPDSLSLITNNPISCETQFPTVPGSPYPSPTFTGEPQTIGGENINDLPAEYNVDAYFTDIQASSVTTCKTSVLRMWHVVTWACGTPDTLASYPQLIEVVDTSGPQFTCPSFAPVSTNGSNCTASINIPYPSATDNCSGIDRVTVSYPMNFINDLQAGGATIELPIGMNEITYTVYDACLNSNSCTFTIEVEDNNGPTTICRSPNVGLNQNGPTRVYATSFDDGSYDDCGLDSLAVARMDPGCGFSDDFGPFVEFNCCDVGNPVMIVLRAYDEAGNFNDCMTEITVQDKSNALIVAPDDLTVSCQYPIDISDLSEFGDVEHTDIPNAIGNRFLEPDVDSILLTDPGESPVMERFYGLDGVAFDNCGFTIEETNTVQEMSCNRQMITRTFTLSQNGIPQASDNQVITVENPGGFVRSDITFPLDTMIVGSCGGQSIHPDSLGPLHGKPSVDPTPCSSIMVNREDELFYSLTPGDSVCYKVLRTWRVLDWCTTDTNGDPIVYEDVQLIKVVNTQGPAFEPSDDFLSECSTAPNCGPGFISLTQTAFDDCTAPEDLRWRYQIDLFNDGSIDQYGNSTDASDEYPVGTHRIIWSVEDECGNETDRIQTFEIESCKLPSPICESGIVLELTPMDLDGDGVNETAMNQITASQIGYKSFHACGYDVSLSFDSTNVNDTVMVFDCDDVGIVELELYVTDVNGRQDFCRTYVAIQDNQLVCGNNPGPIYPITGNINSPTGSTMSNIMVRMDGDAQFESMTDDQGNYSFPAMPEGGSYTITPEKNSELLNGVSTFDILLIQQFVLGMKDFNDPLLHIAADVDHNEIISGSDIIELRKLILGINQEFEENTSYRFVDAKYNFSSGNPLVQPFPESYYIPKLDNKMEIDFSAVKVGDVNNSAQYNEDDAEIRSGNTELLIVQDIKVSAGETVKVPVYADDNYNTLYGFQLDWKYNDRIVELKEIVDGQISIDEQNIKAHDSGLKLSVTNPQGHKLIANEPLFYMVISSKYATSMNSLLYMDKQELEPEIYTEEGIANLDIAFRSSEAEFTEFQLLQNQPNPVSDLTTISFSLPHTMNAVLTITDVSGKQVLQLDREFLKGWNKVALRKEKIGAPGMYYYQLKAGTFKASKKMILVD